jgi:hypothetical protein
VGPACQRPHAGDGGGVLVGRAGPEVGWAAALAGCDWQAGTQVGQKGIEG